MQAKRQQFAKQIRKINRQQIKSKLRQQLIQRNKMRQFPLISHTFQLFWNQSHYQLYQDNFAILDIIKYTQFEQLTDEDHQDLIMDLSYLIMQNIILPPYNMKFKKNQDPATAALVAFISAYVDDQQLLYWSKYMGEQQLQLIFLQSNALQLSHHRWIVNNKLFQLLMDSMKHCEAAVILFNQILQFSDVIKIQRINQSIQFIIKALKHARQYFDACFRSLLLRTCMLIIQILVNVRFNPQKVTQIVNILKEQLILDNQIFKQQNVLSSLNNLYQCNPQDYLKNETCLNVLLMYKQMIMNNTISQMNDNYSYLINNVYKLCYNNWRIKQLYDKKYFYKTQFYTTLEQIQKGNSNNPFYLKLIKIKPKQ